MDCLRHKSHIDPVSLSWCFYLDEAAVKKLWLLLSCSWSPFAGVHSAHMARHGHAEACTAMLCHRSCGAHASATAASSNHCVLILTKEQQRATISVLQRDSVCPRERRSDYRTLIWCDLHYILVERGTQHITHSTETTSRASPCLGVRTLLTCTPTGGFHNLQSQQHQEVQGLPM